MAELEKRWPMVNGQPDVSKCPNTLCQDESIWFPKCRERVNGCARVLGHEEPDTCVNLPYLGQSE